MTRDFDVIQAVIVIVIESDSIFRKWIRLTTHWVISDCDLGKVSVYTSSRDCVELHMHVVGCVCVLNFETKFF